MSFFFNSGRKSHFFTIPLNIFIFFCRPSSYLYVNGKDLIFYSLQGSSKVVENETVLRWCIQPLSIVRRQFHRVMEHKSFSKHCLTVFVSVLGKRVNYTFYPLWWRFNEKSCNRLRARMKIIFLDFLSISRGVKIVIRNTHLRSLIKKDSCSLSWGKTSPKLIS